ncbi:cytochrome c peroxidase [Bradyrhizobium sp. SSUT112]|uniref:cytochrome-c peroxidase n=1 Tax=Bradyrhizobium sp. SSUT112 TaxID=3040604 RepID=UPI00244A9798|nr:cytochrome c peroxidase [Bradyrhizobium sp. SSUT112]MDH2352287.1 cytochrome c peroxidase [Bradyrhizobium sp. SSUT112]
MAIGKSSAYAKLLIVPVPKASGRRKLTRFAIIFGVTIALGAATNSASRTEAALPSPPLVSLGEHLFRSPSLSRDGSISCQTCHIPALGFSGDRPLAMGVAGFVSGRHAPSLLGLAEAKSLMWDGRAADLRSQATFPLESPEMAIDWPVALQRLNSDQAAGKLVAAFGGADIDRDLVLDALAAYVASLVPGESRFDRYNLRHDERALTPQELVGFRLFTRKARCAGCHLVNAQHAPFTDGHFHATGVGCRAGSCGDAGRAAISGNQSDTAAFKTPGLRGVALRRYLMHDGSVSSLRAAVERYNRGPGGTPALDGRLGPLYLSADEVDAIVAFLGALTPENLINTEPVSISSSTKETR